jgi:hypothetical protein
MYSVFVRLDNGVLIFVTCCEQLEESVQFVLELNALWPRDYLLCDSEGKEIVTEECSAMFRNPVTNRSPYIQ